MRKSKPVKSHVLTTARAINACYHTLARINVDITKNALTIKRLNADDKHKLEVLSHDERNI